MLSKDCVIVIVGTVFGGIATVTTAVPEALLKIEVLELSGMYVTISVSLPNASEPAGIVIVALPAFKVTAVEVKLPLVSVTAPVGAGLPLTVVMIPSACAVVMLDKDGVAVTVGVVFAEVVTVTGAEPDTVL
jgi:hypothetical protein